MIRDISNPNWMSIIFFVNTSTRGLRHNLNNIWDDHIVCQILTQYLTRCGFKRCTWNLSQISTIKKDDIKAISRFILLRGLNSMTMNSMTSNVSIKLTHRVICLVKVFSGHTPRLSLTEMSTITLSQQEVQWDTISIQEWLYTWFVGQPSYTDNVSLLIIGCLL